MSISEYLTVKKVLFQEQLRVIKRYYPKHLRFALIDILLGASSLFFNPYRICRKKGFGPYGETPITTLHRIASFCELTPTDTWVELGSGRGKSCFWVSLFVGCRVLGFEAVPFFFRFSKALALLFRTPTDFHRADFYAADLSKATCIYLYSTCMSDEELRSLIPKIPPKAKVVTISAPMDLPVLGTFPVTFPWGTTEAFLHQKP